MNNKYCTSKKITGTNTLNAFGPVDNFFKPGTILTYKYLDNNPERIKKVEEGFSEIMQHANIYFEEVSFDKEAIVRISFNDVLGSWSYIGKEVLQAPNNTATMNIGWLDVGHNSTCLHEILHLLNASHEHSHPETIIQWNKDKVYDVLTNPPHSWTKEDVDWNVFYQYEKNDVTFSEFDEDSIMLYTFPKEWSYNGYETKQNKVLSHGDINFLNTHYPKTNIEPIDPIKNDDCNSLEILNCTFVTKKSLKRLTRFMLNNMAKSLNIKGSENKDEVVQAIWDFMKS